MKKIYILAAVVVAGLVVFKLHNTGRLKIPVAITSHLPWKTAASAPMGRELPGRATVTRGTQVKITENVPVARESSDVTVVVSQQEDVAAPREIPSASEDVNARIERAMEAGQLLVAQRDALNAAATSAAKAAASPSGASVTNPGAAGTAAFAGTWDGTYDGPDSGALAIGVSSAGQISGAGVSSITGLKFTLSGQVSSSGQVEIAQSGAATAGGATSEGAQFVGKMAKNAAGTWSMPGMSLSGSWRASPRAR